MIQYHDARYVLINADNNCMSQDKFDTYDEAVQKAKQKTAFSGYTYYVACIEATSEVGPYVVDVYGVLR